jgi:hypothetical protein
LKLERLTAAVTANFETYRLENPRWTAEPFEGRHPVTYTAAAIKQTRTLPAGAIIVWLNQTQAKIALHLLEPDSPDSLLAWGFFDAIFEQKEYAEDYVLEKLAAEMLQQNPVLKKEFLARLNTDATFRASSAARLRFFYDRSPYIDAQRNLYPIVRVTEKLPLQSVALESN